MTELYTRFTLSLSVPPPAVWRALTDPTLTPLYLFGCAAISDWAVGSLLEWRGTFEGQARTFVTGRVVVFQPCERLEYTTFDPASGLEDVPANHLVMRCVLTPSGGGTRLELSQGDFAQVANGAARFEDAKKGSEGFLGRLKEVCESVR